MLIIKPGGLTGKHATPSISDEFAMVFEGTAVLKLQDSEQVLERGDSVTVVAGTGVQGYSGDGSSSQSGRSGKNDRPCTVGAAKQQSLHIRSNSHHVWRRK